jgi:hypothetical protein
MGWEFAMTRLRPLLDNLLPTSVATVVVGILLVLVSELGDIHELRIFGAALISGGGLGIGTATGLADPRTLRVPDWVRSWRAVLGIAAGWLAILPVLIVLAMALAGVFGDGGDRDSLTLILGALIIILMGVAVLVAGLASLWRIYDASNDRPGEQGASAGEIAEAKTEG